MADGQGDSASEVSYDLKENFSKALGNLLPKPVLVGIVLLLVGTVVSLVSLLGGLYLNQKSTLDERRVQNLTAKVDGLSGKLESIREELAEAHKHIRLRQEELDRSRREVYDSRHQSNGSKFDSIQRDLAQIDGLISLIQEDDREHQEAILHILERICATRSISGQCKQKLSDVLP